MRVRAVVAAVVIVAALAGCGTSWTGLGSSPEPSQVERLVLEPGASPVAFRWLSPEAVLVAPKTGARELASFGNFVDRSARTLGRTRLAVWDDESAWRRAQETSGAEVAPLAHKRAEFLKDTAPVPVEEFTVFDLDGSVVYERDFRDWPLTTTDE